MNMDADVRRADEALAMLRNRETGEMPDELFARIEAQVSQGDQDEHSGQRFWAGAGFGGAVAAALFALALTFGWIGAPVSESPVAAEFMVALGEPRDMNIAIETEQALQGASISILLSGGVELDGYAGQRELTWTSDLDAGVNRLSLPIVGLDASGGQMIVRLSHPDSEQVFVVELKPAA